jgi:hypothetical protein
LREYAREKGYLRDTCLSAQDAYEALAGYFFGGQERGATLS